ncbi:MAG: hypothetical protein Q9160_007729 [Pyrenula sp. 1 TL-2023]
MVDTETLRRFRNSGKGSQVSFTVKYFPYQLYPSASKEGEDKYEWYRKSRYGDPEEKMRMYITLMSAYGADVGIDFKFGGTVANTLDAHRVIQRIQEESGAEATDKLINALYQAYFENEQHPSSDVTLISAGIAAGLQETDVRAIVDDRAEGLQDVKMLIREQAGNGVESVPCIVLEGKRRDLTLVGLKEVEEYVKAMESIAKESV